MFLRTWDRKIDRYIACSEFTKSQFVEEGLAADKLSVRPNFLYETPSIEIGTKSDFVVYFGELDKSHGVQVLMDAWRLAEKKYKLLVIGSGPLESTVRRMEVESGGEVEYLGHQPPSVVYRILSDAKLCIAPSLLPDVSSRVLVDAYSMGTPVVASDIGGFSENILVGETGWLVEAGNAFLLATAIANAIRDDKTLEKFALNARRYYDQKFTAERNYQKTLDIYNGVIANQLAGRLYLTQISKSGNETSHQSDKSLRRDGSTGGFSKLADQSAQTWPKKVNVFGLGISVTDYDTAVKAIARAAKERERASISCHAAHAVVTFTGREDWTKKLNQFEMITPDGQPVRWAMNLLHNVGLIDRVYGPELTLRVCEMTVREKLSVFLYGGSPSSLELLKTKLVERFPDLQIAGAISPPYREITDEENAQFVEQINSSKAHILFVGLGCPKQDLFVSRNRRNINAVQICVGAAFDFHAGIKKVAPAWMQKHGLEWFYRLLAEPRRLFWRYATTNSVFIFRLIKQLTRKFLP